MLLNLYKFIFYHLNNCILIHVTKVYQDWWQKISEIAEGWYEKMCYYQNKNQSGDVKLRKPIDHDYFDLVVKTGSFQPICK